MLAGTAPEATETGDVYTVPFVVGVMAWLVELSDAGSELDTAVNEAVVGFMKMDEAGMMRRLAIVGVA